MEFKKIVFYDNCYTKKKERIELKWNFEQGFDTNEEAVQGIINCGQNPIEFSYIFFKDMIYPISICGLEQAVIISKEYIWYKRGKNKGLTKYKQSELENPLYIIENTKTSGLWTGKIKEDLLEFEPNVKCELSSKIENSKSMIHNGMIIFCGAMFDTMISVYELNCMDNYFADSPSRQKLWQNGIIAFNPYSHIALFTEGEYPYTYKQYCNEKGIQYVDYKKKNKEAKEEISSMMEFLIGQEIKNNK